jgi:hypothetical protein
MYREDGRLTMRKLAVFLEHLPPESATMTVLRAERGEKAEDAILAADPADAPWSSLEMLVATMIDELRGLRSAYATVHTGSVVQPPEPISRPGTKTAARKKRNRHMNDAQRAYLDEQRKRLSPAPLRAAEGGA